jgi:hypothetical protein
MTRLQTSRGPSARVRKKPGAETMKRGKWRKMQTTFAASGSMAAMLTTIKMELEDMATKLDASKNLAKFEHF